ncbi:MAG: hypothetical protein IKJ42_01235 [Bacteroidaceae bacterium]|nr:hypothetical protein [Bacteroidaceae bacterium]
MKNLFLILATGLLMSSSLYAQEKSIANNLISSTNHELIVKKPTNSVLMNRSITSFTVNMEHAGEYYLSCWMLGGQHPDGRFSSFDVSVNGTIIGKMNAHKANWQSCQLNTGTIALQKGENVISFATQVPEIPNIEFIKLASTQAASLISSSNYDNNLASIKENSKNYAIASIVTDTLQNTRALVLDQFANYAYREQVPLHYTFYTSVYLTQGQNISFSAKKISGATPILEVFHSTTPETYTWSIFASSQDGDTLNITIPVTGHYRVRARSYQNTVAGVAEVNIGSTKYAEVPIYSYGLNYNQDTERVYNTFTANLKLNNNGAGDPIIYIGRNFPDKIVAYNDDYSGNGDFDWDYNSRIKKQFSTQARTVFLSNLSSYEGTKPHCDLYIGCWNSTAYAYFPNLHQDDAIQSAPYNADYNCISWSGGITSYWEWPAGIFSQYHVDGNDLASFDIFYLTPRYTGCGIYSRNGATESNSVVDLWGFDYGTSVEYTHASIKHGADDHPHGYDWESKPGELARTFHPRYSLEGNAYGEVLEFYRLIGIGQPIVATNNFVEQTSILSLDESIAEGLSVLETITFTDAERTIIDAEIANIGTTRVNTFESKYQDWVDTWANMPYSSPDNYKNEEYYELKTFCESFYESRFLIFDKLGDGDIFNLLLVEDLTLTNNVANNAILNDIKEDNANNSTTENGAVIVRSPYSNSMKYVKQLINAPFSRLTRGTNSIDEKGVKYSNSDEFIATTSNGTLSISFNLQESSRISLSVVDLQGRVLTDILQNKTLEEGEHAYQVEIPTTDICLVRYSLNGNLNIKKISLK